MTLEQTYYAILNEREDYKFDNGLCLFKIFKRQLNFANFVTLSSLLRHAVKAERRASVWTVQTYKGEIFLTRTFENVFAINQHCWLPWGSQFP